MALALTPDPEFDPHDLKHKGERTPKHAFRSEPYSHQEFPLAVYKINDNVAQTKPVADQDELDAAIADGWSKEPLTIAQVSEPIKAVPVVVVDPATEPVSIDE